MQIVDWQVYTTIKNQQLSYISTAIVDLFYNACIKVYKLKRMVFCWGVGGNKKEIGLCWDMLT